jgi:hypothetical protein
VPKYRECFKWLKEEKALSFSSGARQIFPGGRKRYLLLIFKVLPVGADNRKKGTVTLNFD